MQEETVPGKRYFRSGSPSFNVFQPRATWAHLRSTSASAEASRLGREVCVAVDRRRGRDLALAGADGASPPGPDGQAATPA